MPNPVTETGCYENITSTTTIYTGAAQLLGILCATTTSGTVIVTDGSAAVTGTITLTAGQWYPIPASCVTSIVVTIANTANVTVFYNPG
jgi:hypothetical protein